MAFSSRLLLCLVFVTLCYGFIAAQDLSSEADSVEPEEHSLILSRLKRQQPKSNSQGKDHHGSGSGHHRRHHGSGGGYHHQGETQGTEAGTGAQVTSQRLRRQAAPAPAPASSEEHPHHRHGSGSGHHGRKHHEEGQVAVAAGQRLKRQQTGTQQWQGQPGNQQQWQGHHGGSGHHGSGHHHRNQNANGGQSQSAEKNQQVSG